MKHSREHVRHQIWKHKKRTLRKFLIWCRGHTYCLDEERWWNDPAKIGRAESVHTRECSCCLCGNPRKYRGVKTLSEIRFDLEAKTEFREQEEGDEYRNCRAG